MTLLSKSNRAIGGLSTQEVGEIVKGFMLAASWGNWSEFPPTIEEWREGSVEQATEFVKEWLLHLERDDLFGAISGMRYLPCFEGSPLIGLGAYLFWSMNGRLNRFKHERGLIKKGLDERLYRAIQSRHIQLWVRRAEDGVGFFA